MIKPSLANSPSLKSAGSTTGKQSLPTPLSQAVCPPANISKDIKKYLEIFRNINHYQDSKPPPVGLILLL